jgi:alginate O-acetyltransferase complex protein AlgI
MLCYQSFACRQALRPDNRPVHCYLAKSHFLFFSRPIWRCIFCCRLIIAGSTVFYAWWRVEYVWLPYLLTLIGWAGTIWIDLSADARIRKRRLVIVISMLFMPLLVVKYANFFLTNIFTIMPGGFPAPGEMTSFRFALPLGISFITFTITAYVVDTYRSKFPVEKTCRSFWPTYCFFLI